MIHFCTLCKAEVNEHAVICPNCGAKFVNRGGWDDRIAGNPGGPPVGGAADPPFVPNIKFTNSSKPNKSSDSKEEGLSTPVIIGISLGGFTLIAGGIAAVILLQSGGSKPRRRRKTIPKALQKKYYDEDDD